MKNTNFSYNHSSVFSVPHTRTESEVKINFDNYLAQFNLLLDVYFNSYKLDVKGNRTSSNYCDILFFHISVYFLMRTASITQLLARGDTLRIPLWVHAFVDQICKKSVTNKDDGTFNTGTIVLDTKFIDVLKKLNSMEPDELVKLFEDSPADGVSNFNNTVKYETTRLIKTRCETYIAQIEEKNELDVILSCLNRFENFFLVDGSPEIVTTSISSNETKAFSVHRFRNSDQDGLVYNSNYSSMKALSVMTAELFACFLFIFKPEFTQNGYNNTALLPGDITLSLEHIDGYSIWKKLVTYRSKTDDPAKGDGDKGNKGKNNNKSRKGNNSNSVNAKLQSQLNSLKKQLSEFQNSKAHASSDVATKSYSTINSKDVVDEGILIDNSYTLVSPIRSLTFIMSGGEYIELTDSRPGYV